MNKPFKAVKRKTKRNHLLLLPIALLLFSCASSSGADERDFSAYGRVSSDFVYERYDTLAEAISGIRSVPVNGHIMEWIVPNLPDGELVSTSWSLRIGADSLVHHCDPESNDPPEFARLSFEWAIRVSGYLFSVNGLAYGLETGSIDAFFQTLPSHLDLRNMTREEDFAKEHGLYVSFGQSAGGQIVWAFDLEVTVQKETEFNQTEATEAASNLLDPCLETAILVH